PCTRASTRESTSSSSSPQHPRASRVCGGLRDACDLARAPGRQVMTNVFHIEADTVADLLERERRRLLLRHQPRLGLAVEPAAAPAGIEQILLEAVDRVAQDRNHEEP